MTARIPESWDLGGNLNKDPIADALLERIKSNVLVGCLLQTPRAKKPPRHTIPTDIYLDLTEPVDEIQVDKTPAKRRNTMTVP